MCRTLVRRNGTLTNDEINEAVAKKLGWVQVPYYRDRIAWKRNGKGPCFKPRFHHPHIQSICNSKGYLPDYCCDIKDAWQIVDKMQSVKEPFGLFEPYIFYDKLGDSCWVCGIKSPCGFIVRESADTAPLAICLAFLKLHDNNSSHLTK